MKKTKDLQSLLQRNSQIWDSETSTAWAAGNPKKSRNVTRFVAHDLGSEAIVKYKSKIDVVTLVVRVLEGILSE